jgi:hypothetical protein
MTGQKRHLVCTYVKVERLQSSSFGDAAQESERERLARMHSHLKKRFKTAQVA